MEWGGNKVGVVHSNPLHVPKNCVLPKEYNDGRNAIRTINQIRTFNWFSRRLTVVYLVTCSICFCAYSASRINDIRDEYDRKVPPLQSATLFVYVTIVKVYALRSYYFSENLKENRSLRAIIQAAVGAHVVVVLVLVIFHCQGCSIQQNKPNQTQTDHNGTKTCVRLTQLEVSSMRDGCMGTLEGPVAVQSAVFNLSHTPVQKVNKWTGEIIKQTLSFLKASGTFTDACISALKSRVCRIVFTPCTFSCDPAHHLCSNACDEISKQCIPSAKKQEKMVELRDFVRAIFDTDSHFHTIAVSQLGLSENAEEKKQAFATFEKPVYDLIDAIESIVLGECDKIKHIDSSNSSRPCWDMEQCSERNCNRDEKCIRLSSKCWRNILDDAHNEYGACSRAELSLTELNKRSKLAQRVESDKSIGPAEIILYTLVLLEMIFTSRMIYCISTRTDRRTKRVEETSPLTKCNGAIFVLSGILAFSLSILMLSRGPSLQYL